MKLFCVLICFVFGGADDGTTEPPFSVRYPEDFNLIPSPGSSDFTLLNQNASAASHGGRPGEAGNHYVGWASFAACSCGRSGAARRSLNLIWVQEKIPLCVCNTQVQVICGFRTCISETRRNHSKPNKVSIKPLGYPRSEISAPATP